MGSQQSRQGNGSLGKGGGGVDRSSSSSHEEGSTLFAQRKQTFSEEGTIPATNSEPTTTTAAQIAKLEQENKQLKEELRQFQGRLPITENNLAKNQEQKVTLLQDALTEERASNKTTWEKRETSEIGEYETRRVVKRYKVHPMTTTRGETSKEAITSRSSTTAAATTTARANTNKRTEPTGKQSATIKISFAVARANANSATANRAETTKRQSTAPTNITRNERNAQQSTFTTSRANKLTESTTRAARSSTSQSSTKITAAAKKRTNKAGAANPTSPKSTVAKKAAIVKHVAPVRLSKYRPNEIADWEAMFTRYSDRMKELGCRPTEKTEDRQLAKWYRNNCIRLRDRADTGTLCPISNRRIEAFHSLGLNPSAKQSTCPSRGIAERPNPRFISGRWKKFFFAANEKQINHMKQLSNYLQPFLKQKEFDVIEEYGSLEFYLLNCFQAGDINLYDCTRNDNLLGADTSTESSHLSGLPLETTTSTTIMNDASKYHGTSVSTKTPRRALGAEISTKTDDDSTATPSASTPPKYDIRYILSFLLEPPPPPEHVPIPTKVHFTGKSAFWDMSAITKNNPTIAKLINGVVDAFPTWMVDMYTAPTDLFRPPVFSKDDIERFISADPGEWFTKYPASDLGSNPDGESTVMTAPRCLFLSYQTQEKKWSRDYNCHIEYLYGHISPYFSTSWMGCRNIRDYPKVAELGVAVWRVIRQHLDPVSQLCPPNAASVLTFVGAFDGKTEARRDQCPDMTMDPTRYNQVLGSSVMIVSFFSEQLLELVKIDDDSAVVNSFDLRHGLVYIRRCEDDFQWKHRIRFGGNCYRADKIRVSIEYRWLGRRTQAFGEDYKGRHRFMEVYNTPSKMKKEIEKIHIATRADSKPPNNPERPGEIRNVTRCRGIQNLSDDEHKASKETITPRSSTTARGTISSRSITTPTRASIVTRATVVKPVKTSFCPIADIVADPKSMTVMTSTGVRATISSRSVAAPTCASTATHATVVKPVKTSFCKIADAVADPKSMTVMTSTSARENKSTPMTAPHSHQTIKSTEASSITCAKQSTAPIVESTVATTTCREEQTAARTNRGTVTKPPTTTAGGRTTAREKKPIARKAKISVPTIYAHNRAVKKPRPTTAGEKKFTTATRANDRTATKPVVTGEDCKDQPKLMEVFDKKNDNTDNAREKVQIYAHAECESPNNTETTSEKFHIDTNTGEEFHNTEESSKEGHTGTDAESETPNNTEKASKGEIYIETKKAECEARSDTGKTSEEVYIFETNAEGYIVI